MRTLLFLFLVSTPIGHAADTTSYACRAGSQPNGLGIQSLHLELSNADPAATMTLTHEFGTRPIVSYLSYYGDQSRYALTPETSNDGDISVLLIKKNGKWTATVKSSTIDTYSILNCQ